MSKYRIKQEKNLNEVLQELRTIAEAAQKAFVDPSTLPPEEQEKRSAAAIASLKQRYLEEYGLTKVNIPEELERISQKRSRLSRRCRDALVAYQVFFVDGPKLKQYQEEQEAKLKASESSGSSSGSTIDAPVESSCSSASVSDVTSGSQDTLRTGQFSVVGEEQATSSDFSTTSAYYTSNGSANQHESVDEH